MNKIKVKNMTDSLSIIIPALNEQDNIYKLLKGIEESFSDIKNLEVVLVDDGSDVELENFIDIQDLKLKLVIIRNSYNQGQSRSIEVGLKSSNGNVIGLIDGDLQNPPGQLKKLYDFYLVNEFDGIVSYRKNRKDEIYRKIISKIANLLLKIFTKSKFKDLGSSIKIIKRECLESVVFKGDMHRFISPMLEARGYNLHELEVEHAERTMGESKYGVERIVPVLVDGVLFYLTNGFTRPSKYAVGKLSFILLIISFLLNCLVIYQKLFNTVFVHRNPLFVIAMVFLLLSIQVFSQIVKINENE